MRVLLLTFLLAALSLAAYGQAAEIFDAFDEMPSDELKARIQNVLLEAQKTNGYAVLVLDAPEDRPIIRYYNENRLSAVIRLWRLDPSKIMARFARGRDHWVELWITPNPSIEPPVDYIPRDFKLNGMKKGELVYADGWGADDILEVEFNPAQFAGLLRANPSMTGRIVIYDRSRTAFRREMFRHLNRFVRKYRVRRRQIRVISTRDPREWGGGTEFWIDPARR